MSEADSRVERLKKSILEKLLD